MNIIMNVVFVYYAEHVIGVDLQKINKRKKKKSIYEQWMLTTGNILTLKRQLKLTKNKSWKE